MNAITIHTRLNKSISGGGVEYIVSSYNAGPRNLLKAIAEYNTECESNVIGYGNIGCGSTWIEIAGVFIDHDSLENIATADNGKTRMARQLIDNAISGKIQKRRDEKALQYKIERESYEQFRFAGESNATKPAYPDGADWLTQCNLDAAYCAGQDYSNAY